MLRHVAKRVHRALYALACDEEAATHYGERTAGIGYRAWQAKLVVCAFFGW